jgi:galactokinase/mevalonate kinase-like predicted kinase
MKRSQISEVMSWMGKRSYAARLKNLGIERLQEIARENGKKGGRPLKQMKATQK